MLSKKKEDDTNRMRVYLYAEVPLERGRERELKEEMFG